LNRRRLPATRSRQDPVQASYGDQTDLYEVASWEVRTQLDRVAVRIANFLQATKRRLLLIVAIALFVSQLVFAVILIAAEPIIGLLAAASAVPALGLAGYLWYRDPTKREPLFTLAVTFSLSVAFATVAGVVNSATLPSFELFGIVGVTLGYFLVVGPIEETVKWLAVRVYAFNSNAFQTVIDGVVYGAIAGVGFATIENLLYIVLYAVETTSEGFIVSEPDAVAIATQRAFVGPGHVVFSAWAGFYLGLAKFNPENRGPIIVKGLLIAAFIHALYNTSVTILPAFLPGLALFGFIILYNGFWFALLYRKVRTYRELYQSRFPGRSERSSGPGSPQRPRERRQ
jgi:RsiW-degrading membrane proteinase PrsW (M82 family)